ncbi:substrate-binding periplasmic protein [Kiloniella litopenaei]|uniref:substrate-binding periplasmic protein n=1 Tax=Kiloniella litopenaei TaxID=1549748 RepID=UPI003BA989A2
MFFFKLFLPTMVIFQLNFISFVEAQENGPIIQTIEQEPYGFVNSAGEQDGYLYKVAELILKQAGYVTKPQAVPVNRLIKNLKVGNSTCILAAKSPFVKEHFEPIEDIGHTIEVGFMPRKGIELNGYEDLKGLRIAIPAGMTIGNPFDEDQSLTKINTPDYKRGVLLLSRGDIDVVVGAIESIKYSALFVSGKPSHLLGEPHIINSFPMSLTCRKQLKDNPVVMRLKLATKSLREDGITKMVISEFFSTDPVSH